MDNEIKQKLKNAPIKEVIIGISFEKLFETPEDIKTFYDNSILKEKFNKVDILKSVKFEINEKPKISQDVSTGYIFCNDDNSESIDIELNTIRYKDSSKYNSYEVFVDKFMQILAVVFEQTLKPLNIKDIGLRYINQFNIEACKLGKDFAIVPTIELATKEDDSIHQFASMNNYLSLSNIQAINNPHIFATIKTMFRVVAPSLLETTFDIDTHDATSYTINSKEELNNKIIELKNFKNLIFFSNFTNAYEMKEFQ